MNTLNRSPGVYVVDERPLSRPMTQASLGGCAMICQLTLPRDAANWTFDEEACIHRLRSIDQFANLIGGESLVAMLALASGFQLNDKGEFIAAKDDKPELRAARFRELLQSFDKRHAANNELQVYTGTSGLAIARRLDDPGDIENVLEGWVKKQDNRLDLELSECKRALDEQLAKQDAAQSAEDKVVGKAAELSAKEKASASDADRQAANSALEEAERELADAQRQLRDALRTFEKRLATAHVTAKTRGIFGRYKIAVKTKEFAESIYAKAQAELQRQEQAAAAAEAELQTKQAAFTAATDPDSKRETKEAVANAKKSLDDAKAKRTEAENKVTNKENERTERETDLQALQAEYKNATGDAARRAELRTRRDAAKEQEKTARSEVVKAKKELEKQKKAVDNAQKQLDDAKREGDPAKETQAGQELTAAQQAAEQAKTALETKEADLAQARTNVENATASLQSALSAVGEVEKAARRVIEYSGGGDITEFWLGTIHGWPLDNLKGMPLVENAALLGPIAVALTSATGFFANGGDDLLVVDVPWEKQTDPKTYTKVLEELKNDDYAFGLICAPGQTNLDLQKALTVYCGTRDTDPPGQGGERFCTALLDAKNHTGSKPKEDIWIAHNRDDSGSTSAAMYWPWLHVGDTPKPRDGGGNAAPFVPAPILMPPSGFVAGIICQTDAADGVHRAPAGMDKPVRMVRGLSHSVVDSLAGELNELGVNCLREFTPGTPVVFGCRTLSSDPSYRYIPVSRVLMSVRKTAKQQLRWAVHRPNTPGLRKSLKRDIEALLERMRKQGQLAGEKPEEAYRVTVDDDPALQRAGTLRVRVEVAPTYPAEFIIVEVAQMPL